MSANSNQGSAAIPCLRYRHAPAMIDWLCQAFGFERQLIVPDGEEAIAHAQLRLGNGMIMLGSVREGEYGKLMAQPDEVGHRGTQSIYLVVDDADAVLKRAMDAGAEVVIPIKDEDYGGRGFTCRDPEGHVWTVGTYDPWAM